MGDEGLDTGSRWRAIQFECKDEFSLTDDEKSKIKSIHDVYIFDESSRTCLCEATPSYLLVLCYRYLTFNGELEDEEVERLVDKYEQVEYHEETYTYMHVSRIKALPSVPLINDVGMEEAIEAASGNRPY